MKKFGLLKEQLTFLQILNKIIIRFVFFNILLLLLLPLNKLLSQPPAENGLINIEYYLVEKKNMVSPLVTKNANFSFIERSVFYIRTSGYVFADIYDDYYSAKKIISNNSIINDSLGQNRYLINSMVKFNFQEGTIVIYFDYKGNYFYDDCWYNIDYNLYYNLFKYFSDELIPKATIEEAKNKYENKYD